MAVQDAELKLRVSLDLAFFRTQLASLGETAAGYKLPINIKFDRVSVQNELTALGRNISQRTYRLEVATNLAAEIKNAGTLAKALRGLDNAVQKNRGIANRAATGQGAGTVDASSFSAMLSRATKPALEALYQGMAKAKIPMADVGKGTVKELHASIMSGVPAITQDIARGLANGLDPKLKESGSKGAKFFVDAFKSATGIASPSKIFKQLGEFSADGLEIGFLNGLKEFKGKAISEIKKIVALMKLELASVGDVNLRAAAGGVRGGVRGGAQYMGPIGPLPLGSAQPWARGSRGMYGGGGYEPYMATQGFGTAGRGASGIRSVFASPSMLGLGQLALPAAGQTSASISQQARIAQAYARSSERSTSVFGEDIYRQGLKAAAGQVPMGGGRFLPPGGGGGAGGGGGGGFDTGGFSRAMGGINLPGAGTIRELGSEFGFATKQVLLFGQAYKALAFIQDFPGQVGNAVAQLQSFRNTLNSITGSATAAADANEFIAAAVEKYNIPLQSARDGFAKLFASMQPAGFGAGEIQNLFLGISKAAATFGLSADKVDRVNYAFAQMASKGQVMSEELKGQLGDVLPGAMGIFAEAAGFKGPDAIQKFGKALEDGVYKGGAMRELLRNVAIQMNKEFGPGAEGAAKTFQGAMNRMQNAVQGLYESFEPAAIGVLNSVMVPLVNTLRAATDGINAYFKGQDAATPAAQNFTNVLKTLVPVLSGIGQNIGTVISQLMPIINLFGGLILQIGRFLALPLVGQLAATYAQVLLLTTAFGALAASGIGAAIAAVAQFIGRGIVFAQVTLGMRVATQQTTVAMYQFGTAIQTVMIKSVIGIALVAISALIARLVELQNAMASVSGQANAMKDAAKASAKLGDVAGVKEAIGNMEDRVKTYERVKKELDKAVKQEGVGSSFYREIPSALAKELMSLGLIVENSMKKVGSGYKVKIGDLRDAYNLATKNVSDFNKAIGKSQGLVGQAQKQNAKLKQTSIIAGGDAGGDGAKGRKVPLNEMLDLESQRQFKMREADTLAQLNKRISDAKRQGNEYEAESLESTREALRLGIEAAALQDYIVKLIDNEAQLVGGKTLSQKAFDNRLEDAKVQLYVRQKELRTALLKIGDTDAEQQKKIKAEQEKFASTLIEIKNENGLISTQEYNRLKIDEQIRKVLQEFPNLTKRQREEVAALIRDKQTQLKIVREEIELLRAGNNTERRRIELRREGYSEKRIQEIIDLEKVRDNIKATREIIDNFVNDTSSDYKGFLKAVISGEDAADALEKFQAGLKDRVLTIFLDFTMKPVEDFFKDVVGGKLIESLFPKGELEKGGLPQAKSTDPVQATNENTNATTTNTTAIQNLTNALNGQVTGAAAGNAAGFNTFDTNILSQGMQSTIKGMDPGVGFGAGGGLVGAAAFSQELGDISTGLQNAMPSLTGFSEAINGFSATSVDSAIKTAQAAEDASKNGSNFLQSLGGVVQGVGMLAGAAMSIVAGIKQIEKGDTSSVLGGIGSILMGVGGGILGFGKLFGANGGIASGGWKPFPITPFANGGMVQGPTLGLVGEGKYNEAIVPLPDGRSIPVQMQGDSIRDKMGGSSNGGGMASPVLSMSFETTTINNVEYVSREQLEQAMMETRKLAVRDGARQGANLAIDKLQQSPNTRRRIGI